MPRRRDLEHEKKCTEHARTGMQAYSALLHAAVKCGETDLAVDVYGQMKGEGMPRDRSIHVTMIEMVVKLGRVSDALAALGELHAIGEPPDTHLYNLVLVAATKLGPPRFALTVYHRCRPCVPLRHHACLEKLLDEPHAVRWYILTLFTYQGMY